MTKPTLQLSGKDGNAFFILGRAVRVLKQAKYPQEDIDKFLTEAKSGNYDHLLQTCFKWFDVE
jgi:hypothetical protein